MKKRPDYTEYMTIKEHPELIGKRARFKDNLKTYCAHLWKKEGIIKQLFQVKEGDLNHVGLSLVFDTPAERYKDDNMPMNSCYIMPDSIELR